MYPTARTWRALGVGAVLAVVGLLAGRPLALVGAGGVAAWVLAHQYAAFVAFARVDEGLSVAVDPLRHAAVVGEEVRFVVDADLAAPVDATVTVEAAPPLTARDVEGETTVELASGETAASGSFTASFPVAGRLSVPAVSVTVADDTGSFTETFTVDVDDDVTVDPRQPRNIHVGQGGEQVAAAYGEHPAGRGGAGIVPEEIRQYAPGDSLSRIDWKATARLRLPHVREFESETDRKTVLVVDHRAGMGVGPEGETMLDYAREVAIGYAGRSEELSDPLGLYAVGDGGVTASVAPSTARRGYQRIRDRLHALEPTAATRTVRGTTGTTRPVDARSVGRALAGDDSAFGRTLAPFFSDTEAYVHRIGDDPLFDTLRRVQEEVSGTVWTVVLTDDGDPDRVRDAARIATRGGNYASVFLTPRVLYEQGTMADVEGAYDRYLAFERFRKQVDRVPRAAAYELGPGDRLDALLAARRRRA